MTFLIDYDRRRGELISIERFTAAERDVARRKCFERELDLHRNGIERELVLLEAHSEAALRKTHGRYFADLATLAEELITSLDAAVKRLETRTR